MDSKVRRRDFLRTAQAAAGMLAYASQGSAAAKAESKTKAAEVAISGSKYTPVPDYPIQPKRYSEVKIKDTFWKPKITTNAEVTIPFEVQKASESGSRRGFGGGVLEAAILSLQTHPDDKLKAHVDASIQAMTQASGGGNHGFEIAAPTTTRRETGICWTTPSSPPTPCMRISRRAILPSPAASGTQSTACNCIE